MYAKKGMGARNPIDMVEWSAIYPISGGKIAPPTIDIIMYEEAFFVFGPRSLIARAKMVGNMIDMKKNIRYKATIDAQPRLRLTTGNNRQHINA
jgi:hypothetical protein